MAKKFKVVRKKKTVKKKLKLKKSTSEPKAEEKKAEETAIAKTDEVTLAQAGDIGPKERDTVSMVMEGSVHLPVVTAESTDLALEHSKLEKLPKFACSTCTISSECPEFKEGYVCAFNDAFSAFGNVRSVDNVMELMRFVVNKNSTRMMRALLQEEIVSGGQLDPQVTRQTEVVLGQLERIVRLSSQVKKVGVQFSGPGALQTATNDSQQGGGILSKLFGSVQEPIKDEADAPLNLASDATVEVEGQSIDVPGGDEPNGENNQNATGGVQEEDQAPGVFDEEANVSQGERPLTGSGGTSNGGSEVVEMGSTA